MHGKVIVPLWLRIWLKIGTKICKSSLFWYIFAQNFEKSIVSFICRDSIRHQIHPLMKVDLQLITAAVLSFGGLVLFFCGIFIDPQGQIHETLLVAFGETATFAGALFGIDYVYKKKK